MAKDHVAAWVADVLKSSQTEILERIKAELFSGENDKGLSVVEQWLQDLIDYLYGLPGHTSVWGYTFVDKLRKKGLDLGGAVAAMSMRRDFLIRFCLEKVAGLSDTGICREADTCREADICRVILESDDHILRQLGTFYSETERKSAAAEQRRQKVMAATMVHAFVILDSEGAMTLVNDAFATLIGIPEDRLVHQNFLPLCDTATATVIRRELRQKRGTPSHTVDGTLVGSLGARIPMRFSVRPMFDEDGLRNGAAVSMSWPDQDADGSGGLSRVRIIEDVANIFDGGMYVVDAQNRVVSANKYAQEFVIPGQEEPRAYCCRKHLDERGNCGRCFCKGVFETGRPYRSMLDLKAINGATRWVDMVALPLRNERGQIAHLVKGFLDLTEQKALEDQFLIQQSTSLVSQLAVTVAHQLRNPLGIMIGFAEMLSRGMTPDQIPMAADKIFRNGIRCKEIIEHLLQFGRGTPGDRATTNLNVLLRERVQPMYPDPMAGRITWKLDDTVPRIECAQEQLALVFIHLLDNALKAARNRVIFETKTVGDTVRVTVSDDGPGVPIELRQRIFEPFYTTRKDDGGTGLGLCLARTIVQTHQGRLYLDESVAEGACFCVELPTIAVPVFEPPPEAGPEESKRPGHHILIVEDEPDLVFLLTLALEILGHQVDCSATGAHAVDLINSGTYDAVAIDFLLGDELSGQHLYRILQRANPDLAKRTLFITGDTMKYQTRRFLQEVGRPFLEKPFLIADFTDMLTELLESEPA